MGNEERRLTYRSDIEGLRAIAILFVIAVHAQVLGFGGGFIGVDIFFVLSGFLIAGLLVQEVTHTGSIQFVDFYIRRLRRLLPALIFMLIGSGVLAWWVLAPSAQLSQANAGASAALWLSNVHFALQRLDYFSPGTETNIFLHTWSLGVEEQFYLVWPALIFLLLRHVEPQVGRLRLRWCMWLVFAVSFTACIGATYAFPRFAFYMMPLRAWQFALGAIVSLESRDARGWIARVIRREAIRNAIGWFGLALLFAVATRLDANKPYPGAYALLPTLGAALVIAAGSYGRSLSLQSCLSWKPMQAVGRISYSWYLWHWPVLLLGYALVGSAAPIYRLVFVAVSLLVAYFSYRYVESPLRHQRWWLEHKRPAFYGSVMLMVVCVAGALQWYSYAENRTHSPEQGRIAASRSDAPAIYAMGCDDWYLSARVRPCVFGSPQAAHTAVLFGDSIAGQWFPAVAQVFAASDWRLIVLTKSACPMVDQTIFYARIGRMYNECTSWRNAVLNDLTKLKPDVVVISSAPNITLTPEQWMSGSQRIMQSLAASTTHVYVLRATPHLPMDGPECLAERLDRPRWFPQVNRQNCSFPSQDAQGNLIFTSIKQAAKPFENVEILDLSDQVCPGDICSSERNGMIVFRDSQHMTATFAASLAPALSAKLELNDALLSGNKAASK